MGLPDKYSDIIKKADEVNTICELVINIEDELEILRNLYESFTKELTGRSYSVFQPIVNYKEVLDLKGLDFKVMDCGFTKGFFLTYKKPSFWWFKKKKVFYFVRGYTFTAEHDDTTRYDFDSNDYSVILNILKNENKRLKNMIDDVKSKKSTGDINV